MRGADQKGCSIRPMGTVCAAGSWFPPPLSKPRRRLPVKKIERPRPGIPVPDWSPPCDRVCCPNPVARTGRNGPCDPVTSGVVMHHERGEGRHLHRHQNGVYAGRAFFGAEDQQHRDQQGDHDGRGQIERCRPTSPPLRKPQIDWRAHGQGMGHVQAGHVAPATRQRMAGPALPPRRWRPGGRIRGSGPKPTSQAISSPRTA